MKSIVIVGAGPAGLVAAKTLLRSGPGKFHVTILEQTDRVGGMWAVRKGETGEKCSPEMPTNLSRYTVAFSDLSWTSMDLEQGSSTNDKTKTETKPPMFPKAWQVGRYLEAYAKKYIPPESIKFNCRVVKAEKIQKDGIIKWQVRWTKVSEPDTPDLGHSNANSESLQDGNENDIYDYLVVAPGFFTASKGFSLRFPPNQDEVARLPFKTQHSSKFRSIYDLVRPNSDNIKGNVVVVGGGMSGSEAAAIAAMQISDSIHSPNSSQNLGDLKVVHITTRPFYALPRYHPRPTIGENQAHSVPSFAPLDLCSNELKRRQDDPIRAWNGKVTPERASKTHNYLHSVLGGNQSDWGSGVLVCSESEIGQAPYIGITDTYAEFVRSGLIVPIRGSVVGLEDQGRSDSALSKSPSVSGYIVYNPDCSKNTGSTDSHQRILDVRGVILAQGFTSHPGISWLSRDVLEELEFDEDSHRLPIVLQNHQVYNDRVPSLGFVGFYEGAYWGILEMQARVLTKKWLSMIENEQQNAASLSEDVEKELDFARDLRRSIKEGTRDIPQFWMGDYTGVMESMARELNIPRNDSILGARSGPILAARYTTEHDDQFVADEILEGLADCLKSSREDSLYVSMATFRALQGRWKLSRTLNNALDSTYSGTFNGTADFHPRYPTDPAYDAEYLYIEQGTLLMNGHEMPTTKRYAYRYQEKEDKLSVWFVKLDGKTIDYFFHDVEFGSGYESMGNGGTSSCSRTANGYHICIKDHYTPSYKFEYAGTAVKRFEVIFDVKGPKKDYSSHSTYVR